MVLLGTICTNYEWYCDLFSIKGVCWCWCASLFIALFCSQNAVIYAANLSALAKQDGKPEHSEKSREDKQRFNLQMMCVIFLC